NGIIIYLLQYIGEVPAQQIPIPVTLYDYLRGLFIVALTPAICEELLHRGVMLSAYENRGSMRAVVITAILFGIFHFDVSNLLGPILIGIVIGIYVIRTNSIFAGVLAHFLNNAIAESILYATRNDTELFGSATEKIGAAEAAMLVVFVAVGIAVVRALLKLFRKVTDDTAVEIPPSGKPVADAVSVMRQWPLLSVAGMFIFMAAIYIIALRAGIFGV
ncbi:MAG: CPBP family intramembrane metalloprotease, partial [Eubacteriales bacterium]|nr:CPBP family intramembrane metalloprotease [Eubacteriales bacterium]